MEVQHFCHEHPLVYYEEKTKRSFCYLCGEKILDYSYCCIKCKWFYLHKSCFELSQSLSSELHHPLHRKHSLVLTKDRPYGYRLKCNHCKEFLDRSYSIFYSMSNSSFYYRCLSCEFYLHLGCASLPPLLHTMEVEIHDHSLTLLRKLITFTCDACGKEGKDTPYLCLTCAFCVHPICASLHRTVKHVRHQHTLNLTYSLQIQPDYQICLLCVEKVDTKYGFYYCSSCTFVAHLSCAADGEIEDNVNVLKDEDKESIEPITALRYGNPESANSVSYVVKKKIIGEEGIEITTQIEHFSHQHELTFTQELKNSDKCDACKRSILTPFYNCTQCCFVLHKFCAELPRKKWHPLHQHLLTLSKNPYGSDIGFGCNACARFYNGFTYNCYKCGFDLDVNCSLTSDRLTHDSHMHRGLILSNATRSGKCSVCDSKGYVFRCVDCAFALDFKCTTLPGRARYENHKHLLTLQYTLEDDSGEYYCDICEEERHPKHWYYYCADCNYLANPDCVLGEKIYL